MRNPMKFCPQCHLLVKPEDCDGIPILICGGCGGCWFTSDCLDEAISSHSLALADLDMRFPGEPRFENYAGLTAYCPECRTEALKDREIPGSQTPLLACPRCLGVWVRSGSRKGL